MCAIVLTCDGQLYMTSVGSMYMAQNKDIIF
jgi:hypothetical protein